MAPSARGQAPSPACTTPAAVKANPLQLPPAEISALLDAPSPSVPGAEDLGPLPRGDSVQSLLCELALAGASANTHPVVRGVDATGHVHEEHVTPETDSIVLSGLGLRSVALAQLCSANVPALRELSLAANALPVVDLAPLAHCAGLSVVALNSNALRSIDLTPLSSCTALERLWLHDNRLERLDLTPLSSCTRLRSLYLDDNAIHKHALDLSPLVTCRDLRSLRLCGNELAGKLDITPLLASSALSQLATSPGVSLVATGQSSDARVSPALRRLVLDITFRPPDDSSASGPSTPPPSRVRQAPTFSPVSPPLRSARRRPAPPKIDSTPSSIHRVPVVTARKPVSSQSPTHPASQSVPIDSPVVNALLVGFRRLGRYAAEDALSRCGRVSLTAVEPSSALEDPDRVLASHVVVMQAPHESALRQLAHIAGQTVPLFVFGSERYRNANAKLLRETLGDVEGFFAGDPATPTGAQRAFSLGLARAMRLKTRTGSHGDGRQRLRRTKSLSLPGTHRRTKSVGAVMDEASSATWSLAKELSSEAHQLSSSMGAEELFSSDEEEAINIELTESPPRSLWDEVSARLRRFKRPSVPLSPSLPYLSSGAISSRRIQSTAVEPKLSPEVRQFRTRKLRAERASIQSVFSDMGGEAREDDFPILARAVGLPKCAGPLLYKATSVASSKVEATTPETGVPMSPSASCGSFPVEMGQAANPVSATVFLEYWTNRLHTFPSETRLFHVIVDSRNYHEKTRRCADESRNGKLRANRYHPSSHVSSSNARSIGSREGRIHGSFPRSLSNDSNSSALSTSSRGSSPSPDTGEDGLCGLHGCDEGVGELIRAFMRSRSSRFGMFALVKPAEAVCIATALILFALRGECGSRVGGRARPVSAREIRVGRLNAALIAAEAGIFEGVGANLSMDKIRNIKGHFTSEASPEALSEANGAALNCSLSETEIVRYNAHRQMMLPRGVAATLTIHCHGRKHMTLAEFAVMHTASSNLTLPASADYFFSLLDCDQDDYWSVADLLHFYSEKERTLRRDSVALSSMWETWSCICDNVRPADISRGISRSEFAKLSPSDRKTIIESLLFKDDQHATLNIRQTVVLEAEAAQALDEEIVS